MHFLPAFVRQHSTDRLRFVQVPGVGASSAYSQNDLRFDVFLDWLQASAFSWLTALHVCMCAGCCR